MRKILFRGQRMDNEEWGYGFYNHIPCGRFLCDEHLIQTVNEDGRIGDLHRVYERTVGQYTGLTDKNGAKIFEGDILGTNNRSSYIWIVDFKAAAFCANQGNCNFACELSEFMELTTEVEVIGNIHDNPELL